MCTTLNVAAIGIPHHLTRHFSEAIFPNKLAQSLLIIKIREVLIKNDSSTNVSVAVPTGSDTFNNV